MCSCWLQDWILFRTTIAQRHIFQFPEKDTLRAKWIEFVQGFCIDHFESIYLSLCKDRALLNYSLNPIPTIHPTSIAKSQSVIPNRVRKSPTLRISQKDELSLFKDKSTLITKDNIGSYMKVSELPY